jgi:hypothetical protein
LKGTGNGSASRLAFDYHKTVSNTFVLHVPYRGVHRKIKRPFSLARTVHPEHGAVNRTGAR